MPSERKMELDTQIRLTVKEFIETETTLSTLRMRERLLTVLLICFTFVIVSTITIFFLQGFEVYGFNLDRAILQWLGAATIGEVAGLIYLTIKAYLA